MKISKLLYVITQAAVAPITILSILSSNRFHPKYRLSLVRKLWLGYRFFFNRVRVPTATSPKVHLAMALKLLELPPEESGAVVECGTWKGGTAVNLSIVCKLTGRRLIICDSFEGLPL